MKFEQVMGGSWAGHGRVIGGSWAGRQEGCQLPTFHLCPFGACFALCPK